MNKYKKIFNGLGLLSITTLIGASVVACANNKSSAKDTQSTLKQSQKWQAPKHNRVPSGTELLGFEDNINGSISEQDFNRQIQGHKTQDPEDIVKKAYRAVFDAYDEKNFDKPVTLLDQDVKFSEIVNNQIKQNIRKDVENHIALHWGKWNELFKDDKDFKSKVDLNNIGSKNLAYFRNLDWDKLSINQILNFKSELKEYHSKIRNILIALSDLRDFGDKFNLNLQSKALTQNEVNTKLGQNAHGDFNKLKAYREKAFTTFKEKSSYETWTKNKNDDFYDFFKNQELHKMLDYNLSLTQITHILDTATKPKIKFENGFDPKAYTEQQIIEAINKKNDLFKKLNENVYIELDHIKFNHLFDTSKDNKARFYEKDGWKIEQLIKPNDKNHNKLTWYVRVIFDNKSTDEFKLKFDKKTNHVWNTVSWKQK
ncbi:hypothetical protein RRG53_00180 [Mycoplasmopsis cynos]|uniref:hypothetical protein n=1 Tax=Mycoplasmopsis cynos TaxID=171284 RepID=UPI0021FFD0C4|nr:hypothetical protein [Mycoplasmopsis cynos]MCU9936539.1 hypothetical protein [Mycoplasmopsis cynos]UWV82466.1 hypothetical protein NW067_05785 [Mycoplasmopsis cynos]WQQ18487.1 hypothetical protein RRG53_00180 [Mycoplasmopsis cynos]